MKEQKLNKELIKKEATEKLRSICEGKLMPSIVREENNKFILLDQGLEGKKLYKTEEDTFLSLAKKLIDNGADLNVVDLNGNGLLSKAISKDKIGVAQLLISSGIDLNLPNEQGITPLFKSCELQKVELVKFLVNNKSNVDFVNSRGFTVLHSSIFPEWGTYDMQIIKILIDNKADLNLKCSSSSSSEKLTYLHKVCKLGGSELKNSELLKTLIEHQANVNTMCGGKTALYESVDVDNKSNVEMLVKNGASVNIGNEQDYSPLFLSVRRDHEDILQFLLDNDANINAKNYSGDRAIHFSLSLPVLKLLIKKKADINAQNDNGDTVLHKIITDKRFNLIEQVKFLLENKADVTLENVLGVSVLQCAQSSMNNDLNKLFEEYSVIGETITNND
jgi:ankyrin repeat protein